MSAWTPLIILSLTVAPHMTLAAYCRLKHGNGSDLKFPRESLQDSSMLKRPPAAMHSGPGDFSGYSQVDSWDWPDSRGPPTTIRLPDGRCFWPSDSRSVVNPRELGFEPVDARMVGKFYKRLWDEYRDYEERNATKGRRMKVLDCHYDLLKNTELPLEEKAERFAKEAGDFLAAEKLNASGETVSDKPGDVEKLTNLILKSLKIHNKWFGFHVTDPPDKPRAYTTRNLDVNDMMSRYYFQFHPNFTYGTPLSYSDEVAEQNAFYRTQTEFTTLLPMDVDFWLNAAEYFSHKPPSDVYTGTTRDYLEEAFQAWSRFTHPTTEHVSHRTINLTVFFDRRYTKNDTFDYFSLDQFKPVGWTPPLEDTPPPNRYELKDVVIARYRNLTTRVYPRAIFFYSTYESEYDYNNTYSELDNLDFGNFQGNSSEIESIHVERKTYPPQVPTCPHGFPKDSNYDRSADVSDYDSLRDHITTERATTAPIMHHVNFRYDMIVTGTTITVDMDVLLGRNTWPTKRTTSTTTAKTRKSRTTKVGRTKETCHHGLEITNDENDVRALRGVFERVQGGSPAGAPDRTYRKRSTRYVAHQRNETRTRKTRKRTTVAMTTKASIVPKKKRDVGEKVLDQANVVLGKRVEAARQHAVKRREINVRNKRKTHLDRLNEVYDNNHKGPRHKREIFRSNKDRHSEDVRLDKYSADSFGRRPLESRRRRFVFDDMNLKPAGVKDREKRNIFEGSGEQFVSRGDKEKAYRSYEDYLKKTKNECPEDRVCRLFKEELKREDSFDGLGRWN